MLALGGLFMLSLGLRLPYLWDVPRYTDELQEILWSVSIANGEILPLTAVDSYYGPIWSYLLAGLFLVFGPSPELPRLTAMLLAGAMVIVTYLFVRDVAGRWAAALAAGLLTTSSGHIIINSHTARSNSTTPLLTTIALWLIYRAVESRSWQADSDVELARKPSAWLLVPAGLVLGLALQTHVSVVALFPGIIVYGLWRGRRLLRTPWPYLAGLACVAGYANMLAFNLINDFWSVRHARSLQAGYTDGRATDLDYFLTNLQNLVQSLSRLLSGTIDVANSPSRFLYVALAVLGLALVARRGGLLLACVGLSIVLVLPLFNPRYGPILSGRYLIPLLPLAYCGVGCAVVIGARRAADRLKHRGKLRPETIGAAAGVGLVVFPLLHLVGYYQEVLLDARTNRPLHELAGVIVRERLSHEQVVLDEGLAQEQLGAGGSDLKAYRMLLATSDVPYIVTKVAEVDEVLTDGASALILMEAKKRASLPRGLTASRLSSELESASGSEHRYAVYRLSAR
jgi:4-amino-4-deoxy-L-arabinose transferase-like glycosyltransferase